LSRFETFWEQNAERIPAETTIIFVSPKPDKRKTFAKNILSQVTVKDFPVIKNQEKQFIIQKVGSLLTNNQINLMVQTVGKNLGNLDKECDKILMYCSYHRLDRLPDSLLLQIIFPHEQVDTFKILEHRMSDPQALNILLDDIRLVGVQWNLFF
jgi:DNA polymerase III delta subunit